MNSNIIIYPNGTYSNTILDKQVEDRNREYCEKARLLGATTAIQNIIQPNTPLRVICEPIQMQYNALTAYAHQNNEGMLGIAQGKLQIEKMQDENEALLSEIEQVQATLSLEKFKMGNVVIPTIPYSQFAFALFIGLLLLFTDSYFIGNAFQSTGTGLGISILLGLGISLSVAVISTLGTTYTQKIPDIRIRYLSLLGLALLAASSVYVLCQMREKFYHSQTGQDIGAGKLALLSLLAFVAFHLLYKHMIRPAFIRMKERREVLEKLSKIKKLEDRLMALKKAYTENLQKISETKQFRLAVLAYAKSLETNITRMYREAIAQFKMSFIEQSAFVPHCFSEEPSDLNRFYDDINITPNTHEQTH